MQTTKLSTTQIISYLQLASVENHKPAIGFMNFYNSAYQQALTDAQIAISLVSKALSIDNDEAFDKYSSLVFPKVIESLQMLQIVADAEKKFNPLLKQLEPEILKIIQSDDYKDADDAENESLKSKLLAPVMESKAYNDLFALNSDFIKAQTQIQITYKDLHKELADLTQLSDHTNTDDIDAVKKGASIIYDDFYVYADDKDLSPSTILSQIKGLKKIEFKDKISLNFALGKIYSIYGSGDLNHITLSLGAIKTLLDKTITFDKQQIAGLYGLLKSVPADQSNIDDDFHVQEQIQIDSSLQAYKSPIEHASLQLLSPDDEKSHELVFKGASLAKGQISFGQNKVLDVSNGLVSFEDKTTHQQVPNALARAIAALSKQKGEENKIYYFDIDENKDQAQPNPTENAAAEVGNPNLLEVLTPSKPEAAPTAKHYAIYYTGSSKDASDDVLIKLPDSNEFKISQDNKEVKITFKSPSKEQTQAPGADGKAPDASKDKAFSVLLDNKSVFDDKSGAEKDAELSQGLHINAFKLNHLKPGHHNLQFKGAKLGSAKINDKDILKGKITDFTAITADKILQDLGTVAKPNELYYARTNTGETYDYKFYYTGTQADRQDDLIITLEGLKSELDLKSASVIFDIANAQ